MWRTRCRYFTRGVTGGRSCRMFAALPRPAAGGDGGSRCGATIVGARRLDESIRQQQPRCDLQHYQLFIIENFIKSSFIISMINFFEYLKVSICTSLFRNLRGDFGLTAFQACSTPPFRGPPGVSTPADAGRSQKLTA